MITLGILVIGDEILSGRTQDTNIKTIADFVAPLGIDVKEVRIVPDCQDMIIEAVNLLRTRYTYVITTGGIGSTHDDITFESIAKAFGVPLEQNEEALMIIENHYKDRLNDIRRRMAWMPKGGTLIQNPVSKVPTCFIENVFILAGMPSVMKGMLEYVEPHLKKGDKVFVNTLTSHVVEGILTDALAAIQDKYPTVSIGSYPFYNYPDIGTSIVLRSRNAQDLQQATKDVHAMQIAFGGTPKAECEIPFSCAL